MSEHRGCVHIRPQALGTYPVFQARCFTCPWVGPERRNSNFAVDVEARSAAQADWDGHRNATAAEEAT